MRVLIVDDEALARTALSNVLLARNDVEDFDSVSDAAEAFEKLQSKPYDIVLLDIQMLDLSGIELVDCLNQRNQPFSDERIHEALNIAIRRTASERAARLLEMLPQLRTPPAQPAKIAIKTKGRILFIDPTEVNAVEAQGNYVLLQQQSGSHLLRGSISTLAEKLEPYGFIRIHRSVLVNTSFVQELQPWATGEYILRMRDGKEYSVSRSYKGNLRSIAQFWVGSEGSAEELDSVLR